MPVAVKRVGSDVTRAVSEAMDAAGYEQHIRRGERVLLKVNLGWDLFIPGSVTNPAVFEAVVRKLQGYAGEICVVESDQVLENVERAYARSHISRIAREMGVRWINLSGDRKVTVAPEGNRVIRDVPIPETLTQSTVVTLPVMKTHNKTQVTLSLKNQWGCIPKMRHRYHLHLTDAIADVNRAVGVKFAVLDGTIAMEGNAPKTGIPREVGLVAASPDLVALDSVAARIMGFDPRRIPHLVEAERRGLGTITTDYAGDRFDDVEPFRPARHNLVSRVEQYFRTSVAAGLIFDTPVFWFMLLGAKMYYRFFDWFHAGAIRRKYASHPLYGRYFDA
jgi:uncharacterized protein (DUF362 family)